MEKTNASPAATPARHPRIPAREYPCPQCGYDLRGAVGDAAGMIRCPECGTSAPKRELASSRLPWANRKTRGRVRTYLATLWMPLRRPGVLATEMQARQRRRDAEGYHRISVLLATVLGTGIIGAAYLLNWETLLPSTDGYPFWCTPLFVLLDSWWLLLPLAIGVYFGLRAVLAGYRGIAAMGMRGELEMQRAARLGLYMSSLAVAQAVLLGWGSVVVVCMAENGRLPSSAPIAITSSIALMCGLSLLFTVPLAVVARMGRLKILRGLLMLGHTLLSGPVAMALAVAISLWLAGFLAMAIRSSLR